MKGHILPPTAQRVKIYTSRKSNERIKQGTEDNINYYKHKGKKELNARIDQLDSEWDIERVLETNAATLIIVSSILGFTTRKKYWFMFTGAIGGFLLQHALQGWCPPVPVFRKLGVRTADEIGEEKFHYKNKCKKFLF